MNFLAHKVCGQPRFVARNAPTRPRGRYLRRTLTAAMVALMVSPFAVGPAAAMDPPVFDPARDKAPPNSTPNSEIPMKQTYACVGSANQPNAQWSTAPQQEAFGQSTITRQMTGKGQTVAVLDTGVTPNLRLPGLTGIGDFVMGGDGLDDCDRRGTLLAGIIAARPASGDGFSGIAPDARIVSLRLTSNVFGIADNALKDLSQDERNRAVQASQIRNMARGIVRAADTPGVSVILLGSSICRPAGSPIDDRSLAGALYYASVVRNIVVVATAGNTYDGDNNGQSACTPNPGPTQDRPSDPRGWGNANTAVIPSMWSQFLISVGGVSTSGDPFPYTMPGPWVSVAARATDVVSLDPRQGATGALTNGQRVKQGEGANAGSGIGPLQGTEFAAAQVAGLAALIRQKWPELTAYQVKQRIVSTAHTPSGSLNNVLGEGIVDAPQALTAALPPGPRIAEGVPPKGVSAEPAPTPPDNTARNVALAAMVFVVLCIGTTWVVLSVMRQRRTLDEEL